MAWIDLSTALCTRSHLAMFLPDELGLVLDQDVFEEVRIVEVYQIIGVNALVNILVASTLELLLIRGFSLGCFQLGDLA